MQGYHRLGMQLRLKRTESGLRQETLGLLLGGVTQALISWWESGRYMPGDRYLSRIIPFLELDPMALRVYVRATGMQQRPGHRLKIKTSDEALKMEQRTPFMSGQGSAIITGTLSTASLRLAGRRASWTSGSTTCGTPTLLIWP